MLKKIMNNQKQIDESASKISRVLSSGNLIDKSKKSFDDFLIIYNKEKKFS
jgi:hypothetical protein